MLLSHKVCFLQALGLPQDLPDEDCTYSISKVISAASEQRHSVSIRDILDAVCRYSSAAYLEPLDVLPALLPCRHDGAIDLIRICANRSSPKEITIVLQEAIEYVQTCLNNDEDEGEEHGHDLAQRVIGIVLLCQRAISESKLGERSALELCSPLLDSVASLILSVSPPATREQGRLLITEAANLVKCLSFWALKVADANGLGEIKHRLRELLDMTVINCASLIQASLTVRAVEGRSSRFFVASSEEKGWLGGEEAMFAVELALEALGESPEDIPWKPTSFVDVIYLAHSTTPLALSPASQSNLHHLVVNALQMNMVIDEAFYLLLLDITTESISAECVPSLCTTLTALASTHLDPIVRQLSLGLLSLTLSKLPPSARLEILLRLTTDEDFPQVRGPAVGLLKEAVLEALALPPDHACRNPFASAELLRVFGGVLFRPNPPEFFGEKKTRDELAQSLELLRIADCLSFYYVLLHRDRENKTGVRSKGNVTSVQRSILGPLQRFLNEHAAGEEQPLMAISSLQVCLDRISSALGTLNLDRDT